MAADDRPAARRAREAGQPPTAASVIDVVVKIAALLAAVAGLAGLVVLTGGGVLWARFYASHLPADQAVAVIPREQLLAVGAVALAFFVLGGLLSVFAVYLIDDTGSPTEPTKRGLIALATVGILAAIALTDRPWWHQALLAVPVLVVVFAVGLLSRWIGPRWRRRAIGIELVLVAALAGGLWLVQRWIGLLVLVAALLVAVALGIAKTTGDRFRWYGLAVFLSVAVFGSLLVVGVFGDGRGSRCGSWPVALATAAPGLAAGTRLGAGGVLVLRRVARRDGPARPAGAAAARA